MKSARIRGYSGSHFPTLTISPYSVRIRENADQNNPEYGHFLRSDWCIILKVLNEFLLLTLTEQPNIERVTATFPIRHLLLQIQQWKH